MGPRHRSRHSHSFLTSMPSVALRCAAVVGVLLLLLVPSVRGAAAEASPALQQAVAWVVGQQAADGSFAGMTGEADPGTTADAVVALAVAQAAGIETEGPLRKAVGWLATRMAETGPADEGDAARLALSVVASGGNPRLFNGVDLIDVATGAAPSAATPVPAMPGIYGENLYGHALVLLALAATKAEVPPAAVEVLRERQAENGGWAYDGSTDPAGTDSNTTALVLAALAATGHADDPMVQKGLVSLRAMQTPDGAFAYQPTDPLVADANSTAVVLLALKAVGQDPASAEWKDVPAALAAFQNPSGAFHYSADDPSDNLYATLQAIPALAGATMPVGP